MQVNFADPGRVTVLGHIFASILRRGLADAATARRVAGIGRLGVESGGMALTADFGRDAVTLDNGIDRCRARVAGDLRTLLDLCLTGRVVGPWLEGRLSASGNVLALLPLLAVLKAARS